MKVGLIAGPFCLANGDNGFDFARLWTDPRGLSGSDLGVFRIAQELARLGHEVEVFTFPKPGTPVIAGALGPGVVVRHYDERVAGIDSSFRAAVSWNEAEPLRCFQHRTDLLRVVSLQINSLVGGPNFDDYVDLWLSPSESHRKMILGDERTENLRTHMCGPWRQEQPYVPKPNRFKVVPDGTDIEHFAQLAAYGHGKISGRVVWTSSPDRGLHWLLGEWPKIKRAVPHASLAICYELRRWVNHMLNQDAAEFDPSITEQIRRASYIAEVLPRVAEMHVAELGSLSRRDVAVVQAEAQCFAYSCDTRPVWSEGFSCSLMEACAARSAPVATAIDAFPEIYGGVLPLSPQPTSETIGEFSDNVVRVLTDEKFREELNERAFALAERFTWKKAAERLVEVLG